jgi:hypothetical protein
MILSEDELKEIFSIFCSVTTHELKEIYDESNDLYYKKVRLNEEYELAYTKMDFAEDSWRAVIYYLYRHGYQLIKENKIIGLDFIESEFVEA